MSFRCDLTGVAVAHGVKPVVYVRTAPITHAPQMGVVYERTNGQKIEAEIFAAGEGTRIVAQMKVDPEASGAGCALRHRGYDWRPVSDNAGGLRAFVAKQRNTEPFCLGA